MAYLLVRVRAYVSDIIGHRFEKVRNRRRFENVDMRIWKRSKDIDLRILKKDIDLRYRCLWHRNWTWIWGLDVALSLTNTVYILQNVYNSCSCVYYSPNILKLIRDVINFSKNWRDCLNRRRSQLIFSTEFIEKLAKVGS